MELRQLEYLIAVAEEANFTRAAERVHISQSGVSAQIRQLENELGATLIDRSGRVATLTPAGIAAVEHARAALGAIGAVRQAVDEVNGLVRGQLRVGMVTACTVAPLFDALATFHLAHPGVQVGLYEDNSDRLIESVRMGTTDLALVGAAGAPPEGLQAIPLVSEPIVAAVTADHPLAGHRHAKLADLTPHPLICLPQGTGVRAVFDDASAAVGVRLEIAFQASAPSAVADLACRGMGVAILSASMVANDSRLQSVDLDDAPVPAVLALVWRTSESRALQQLLVDCRGAFGR